MAGQCKEGSPRRRAQPALERSPRAPGTTLPVIFRTRGACVVRSGTAGGAQAPAVALELTQDLYPYEVPSILRLQVRSCAPVNLLPFVGPMCILINRPAVALVTFSALGLAA